MGMLFRMFAPKPLKKARRVAHPVSMVTPRPVKRAKMAAVNTANPAGATKRATKRAIVREVRGSGGSVGRVLSPQASRVVVGVAAAPASRRVETGAPLMEFVTDQHRIVYERIKDWVEQLFGEAAQAAPDDRPSFHIRSGSETVFVHLIGVEDGGVLLNLRTWPCDRAKIPDHALRRMLEINAQSPIGDLMVEGLGETEFSYCALTENLTKESFEFLFYAFARYASEARAELKPLVT
jgi:hypothetical protein